MNPKKKGVYPMYDDIKWVNEIAFLYQMKTSSSNLPRGPWGPVEPGGPGGPGGPAAKLYNLMAVFKLRTISFNSETCCFNEMIWLHPILHPASITLLEDITSSSFLRALCTLDTHVWLSAPRRNPGLPKCRNTPLKQIPCKITFRYNSQNMHFWHNDVGT